MRKGYEIVLGKIILSWRTSRAMSLRQGYSWIVKENHGADCSSADYAQQRRYVEVLRSAVKVGE